MTHDVDRAVQGGEVATDRDGIPTDADRIPTDADGYLPPHQPNCLGCGDQNPGSMGLRLRIDGNRVHGTLELDRRHEGAPGFAHGGAVATVLDDALGTLLMVLRRPAVTAKLEIDYRRPVFLFRRLDVETWTEQIDGRKLWLRGELREAGELLAEASALFLEVAPEHFLKGASQDVRESGGEPGEDRDDHPQSRRKGYELPW